MTTVSNYTAHGDPVAVETYLTAIRCKYLAPTNHRGSCISVSRFESQKDPNRIVVGWDYTLGVGENYTQAVQQYIDKAEWGGTWVVGTVNDGAVAVWAGTVLPD